MRLHVYSDLHLEFQKGGSVGFWTKVTELAQKERPLQPVAILAGDIFNLRHRDGSPRFVLETFKSVYADVIYVPGNHESNRLDINFSNGRVESICGDLDVKYLRPRWSTTIRGQRFLGGTLWYQDPGPKVAPWFYDRVVHFSLEPAFKHNADFVEHVCQEMTHDDIIVSHHLPHPRSVGAQWAAEESNAFFLSDQSAYIETRWPKLWIHGHTHDPKDYIIRPADQLEWQSHPERVTRVYCNPMGYASENANPAFWDRIAIDVSESQPKKVE